MRPALILLGVAAALFGQQPLDIVSAQYGADTRMSDVTERVRGLVRDNSLVLTVDVPTLGSDPAPGTGKTLVIKYKLDGREMEMIARDFEQVKIPLSGGSPPVQQAAPSQSQGGFSIADLFKNNATAGTTPAAAATPPRPTLRIVSAKWGADTRQADVRSVIESRIRDNAVSLKATNQNMGSDPAVGADKFLTVQYELGGSTYEMQTKEGSTLNIPSSSAKLVSSSATSASASSAPAAAASIPPIGQAGGLRIFYARYGPENARVDVRERLRPLLSNDRLSVAVNGSTMGVSPGNGSRVLEVIYEVRGRTFLKEVPEGGTLSLP
ncbi:MAG: DUF3395 domain-containing protein [Bryobacterales bacterium]|nr:DUF3395 domain-containing protein [Bryobacterales bacterium]